jgi:hypothetical protein
VTGPDTSVTPMVPRTPRILLSVSAALALALVPVGCGGGGGMSDEEVIERLQRAGHTPAGAECVLRGTSEQGVSLGKIMDQMRLTQRDDEVVRTVTAYCIDVHGSADIDGDSDTDPDVVGPIAPNTTAAG